jgi:hypothetical protein
MVYKCEGNLCFDLIAEILEHSIVEILGVIDFDVSRDAIAADDILLEEFFDGCGAYVSDGLCLNPFHKVLSCHDIKGIVAMCWG